MSSTRFDWRHFLGGRSARLRRGGMLLALLACQALASATAAAEGADPAAEAPERTQGKVRPLGPAVPIGGGLRDDNHAVWGRLVELAGGRGARFVVFATASGDPEAAARGTLAALERHGAQGEHLRVSKKFSSVNVSQAVRDEALIDLVRSADGVFFTGGDQALIVEAFRPGGVESPLLEAVRDLQRRGGVVAGTSAGAAIMSRTMFRDPPGVVTVLKGPLQEGKHYGEGLGFAPTDIFVDQHFLRRGRIGRVLPLMMERGMTLAIGVEEDSAAVMVGQEIEVLGAGGAVLVDLAEATTDASAGAFNVANVKLSYLSDGDRFDLRTKTLLPSRAKLEGQRLDPRAPGFKPFYQDSPFALDVLAPGVALQSMVRIVDGRASETRGLAFDASDKAVEPLGLGFEFRFSRRPDTHGWYDPVAAADSYTIANIRLDVVPVRVGQPLYVPWRAAAPQGGR